MRWSDLYLRLRALLFRNRLESELAEEIQTHLALETQKHMGAGFAPGEARRRAYIALGGVARTSEECREQRGIRLLENVVRDVRYALRTLRRSPGFALTVVFTMAVAIGANTTVFSFCKAILLNTLPVPNPQALHLVSIKYPGSLSEVHFSYPDLREMQKACETMASLTGFTEVVGVNIHNDSGTTSAIKGQLVAENFFPVLRISPLAGRAFTAKDNQAGAAPVAAISYRFWSERFGQDYAVLGKQIRIQQTPVTIVAVMPPAFEGVEPGTSPDVWMPLIVQSRIGFQGYASMNNIDTKKPWLWQDVSWLHVLARSASDGNPSRLRAALNGFLSEEVNAQLPHVTDAHERAMMLAARMNVTDAEDGLPRLRNQFSLPLQILFVLVGVLLCSGCINLANLLLARSRARRHEIALRLSLGSTRARLIAQQLTETLLLTAAGGLLSVPLAYESGRMILRWLAMGQDLAIDIEPDWKVLTFVAVLTLVSGLAVALLPALHHADFSASNSLGGRSQSASANGREKTYLTSILTGGQIALSVVSLVVAGLLTHTLLNYAHLDIGADRTHVLSVGIDPSAAGYNNAAKSNALYDQLTAAIDRLPGVISSSVGGCGLMCNGCATLDAFVVGAEKSHSRETLVERNYIGPRYFSTVGIEVLRGREITEGDTLRAPPVGVVNRTFEAKFLHGQSAIGKIVSMGSENFRVVGVVRDARLDDIHHAAMPYLYLPVEQAPGGWNVSQLEIRTSMSPMAVAGSVRAAIGKIDRAIPIAEITTLTEETNRGLARELLVGRLAGLFSFLTLLIAALGLYGVLAFRVGQRRAEIGIRMALGATRRNVIRMVFAQALLICCVGSAAGLLLSAFASRLVKSLLFGTNQLDPWTYVWSLSILLCVSAAAATVPAWRASSIDPASAVRAD